MICVKLKSYSLDTTIGLLKRGHTIARPKHGGLGVQPLKVHGEVVDPTKVETVPLFEAVHLLHHADEVLGETANQVALTPLKCPDLKQQVLQVSLNFSDVGLEPNDIGLEVREVVQLRRVVDLGGEG